MLVAKRRRVRCLLLALVLAGVGGCGGAFDATVEGVITLDGDPVPAGAIAFIPADGGPLGYARTDSSGNYEVFTGNEAGLQTGQYGVTVVARESPAETHSKLGGPAAPGKRITPPWYGSSRSSPLTYDVVLGSNEIDITLTSEAPADWKPKNRKRR